MVYLVLEDTAHRLTNRDFLRISRTVEQAHGEIRIRHGSWQVVVGIPRTELHQVEEELWCKGYRCVGLDQESSTFLLGGCSF